MIQSLSDRRDSPFITINCARFLIICWNRNCSVMRKALFPGQARKERTVLLKLRITAPYLDEIADLPLQMQANY